MAISTPQSSRSSPYNLRSRSTAAAEIPTAQQKQLPPHAASVNSVGGEGPSRMGAASGVSSTPTRPKKRTLESSDSQVSPVTFSISGRSSPSGSVGEGRERVLADEISANPSHTKKPRIGFSSLQSQQDGISISRRISSCSTSSILPAGTCAVYNLRSRRAGRVRVDGASSNCVSNSSEEIVLTAENPEAGSYSSNLGSEESGGNSRRDLRNSVVLQVYCRRRRLHVNETHEVGPSNSPSSSSSDKVENIAVISQEAGALLETEPPKEEMCDREPKEEESPTPSLSESLPPEGQGMKEGDIFAQSSSAYIDFDDFKTVRKIELNQIWSLNDGYAWAPRTYARIHKFLPSELKVEVALLDFHPTCDEEASWLERKLPVTCGTFRAGKSTSVRDISDLSHRVDSEDGEKERSFHKILPRKGEVWTIYKGWNAEWLHSDYKRHSDFKLVEIMSDFREEDGVFVAALVQAEGCLTIFQRQTHEGFGLFQWISKRDLVQFSHRVLAVGMGGDGKTGYPKGSWMVDPAVAPIPFNFHTNV